MTTTQTSQENISRIEEMFTSIIVPISNLYSRWQDEQQFEDIRDYGDVIAKMLPDGFKLVQMVKRPFGFKFSIGTDAIYQITANSRSIAWKRIG